MKNDVVREKSKDKQKQRGKEILRIRKSIPNLFETSKIKWINTNATEV